METKNVFENIKVNPVGLKGDYFSRHIANTRHLKRILVWLKQVDYICQSDLRNQIGMGNKELKDGLIFLVGVGLIKKIYNKRINVYCLPYKENLVKKRLRLKAMNYELNYRMKKVNEQH